MVDITLGILNGSREAWTPLIGDSWGSPFCCCVEAHEVEKYRRVPDGHKRLGGTRWRV